MGSIATDKLKRNDLCPCGSGKKYKNCCAKKSSSIPQPSSDHGLPLSTPMLLAIGTIIVIGLLIYGNTFASPFIFDDDPQIVSNPKIRSLFPPWEIFSNNRRPILYLSLAINYALGGLNVGGYHLFNLLIHIGSALLLFGIIRRTLLQNSFTPTWQKSALRISLSIALLWLAHPLQTQSVTYIIQRAESLMAFFYLATLYAVIRTVLTPKSFWPWVAIALCSLGMATKETMITAPVTILLFDRIFLTSSWKEIWSRRKILYAALFSTGGIAFLLLLLMRPENIPTAGFNYDGLSPLQYGLTQTGVILHYLKLILIPAPLVFDYNGWPIANHFDDVVGPCLWLILILFCLAVTLWKNPRAGFLGLWFFVILLPSSSVMPIADVAFEYRVYLPLAGILALLVIGIEKGISSFIPGKSLQKISFITTIGIATATFSFLTIQRNRDYRDEFSLWQDTITKRPNNPRAQTIMGVLYFDQGRFAEAEQFYRRALTLNPQDAVVHNNLGMLFAEQNRYPSAIEHYNKALTLNPQLAGTIHNNLGVVYLRQKLFTQTIAECEKALQNGFRDAPVFSNYGIALTRLGRPREAIPYFQTALKINPLFAEAQRVLAEAERMIRGVR